ncbi:metal ABC transporter ATP-binding protein [Trueperella bialowiezensis]|uniref:Zinc import ATP-binding protein ZnuC n=1 Tax=Trueperella bialowiezensis TaxID=312285 RepID=A0A448PDH0_9ACTO|nr:ATP-binding cassette domain-containing protein [Trueperella bialowiezensis]VEI12972.1 Zinc import ATP-binding protein ZnuC [Trueperella bialowiezensis]
MSSSDAIYAQDITFSYGRFEVLRGVSLRVKPGETVVLTGDNGCGKSTLVKVVIGELARSGGELSVLGQEVSTRRGLEHVGYVPQTNVVSKISFPITSEELAVQGLARDFGPIKIPRKRHLEATRELFATMGLEEYLDVPFGELSGGLQQRVMITRALLADPKLVVLDEPTAGVDRESRVGFLELLRDLGRTRGIAIFVVTHDVALVERHLDVAATYRMEEGVLLDD